MTWTEVACPYDGEALPIEVAFEGDSPVLNINCPDLVAHLREHHGMKRS